MTYNSYQIAEIIGVNVSTIKRWTDSGKLKCFQSVGGHRKFHLNHIAEFLKKNNKTSTDINISDLVGKNIKLANAIDKENYKYLVKYSYENLISGKADRFMSLNDSLILKNYKIHDIFDRILNPTLKKIGDQWTQGNLSITEEHMASEIIKKFLTNINFQYLSINNKYNAFSFTLFEDKHDIPLHMSEAVFNHAGNIKTFNLGQNLPVDDFLNLTQKVTPNLIFISIIYIQDLDKINQEVNLLLKSFSNNETTIFLKGRTEELRLNYSNFIPVKDYNHLYNYISENIK